MILKDDETHPSTKKLQHFYKSPSINTGLADALIKLFKNHGIHAHAFEAVRMEGLNLFVDPLNIRKSRQAPVNLTRPQKCTQEELLAKISDENFIEEYYNTLKECGVPCAEPDENDFSR